MPASLKAMPCADIILDEEIYPRQKIGPHHRVSLFAENLRDNLLSGPHVFRALPPGDCGRHAKEKNPWRNQPFYYHLTAGSLKEV